MITFRVVCKHIVSEKSFKCSWWALKWSVQTQSFLSQSSAKKHPQVLKEKGDSHKCM